MVEVATGTPGTKALIHDYPYEEGLEAGTTKHDHEDNYLEAEEDLVD